MERFKSIKSLMIICFTSIIVVVLLLTGTSLYKKFNDIAIHYATQSAQQLMTQVKYSLDTYTRSMIDVSNTLYYKIIKNQSIQDNTFTNQMSLIQTTNNHIANLAIFKENGELIAANRYMHLNEAVDVTEEEWFKNAIQKQENVHFSSPHKQVIFQDNNSPDVITLSRVVSLNENGNIIQGVLLVDMHLTGIKNICAPIKDSDIGSIYIVAPDGGLVYGDLGAFEVGKFNEAIKNEVTVFEEDKRLITLQMAGYTGWKVIGVWDLTKLLVDYDTFQNFIIAVFVVGFILCIIGTLFISSRLSAPLYKLQKSMKLVEEGNFNIRLPEEGEYIVSELSKTFNRMVERIKGLKHEIVTEQDDKRKKEMEVLQSQINPHFLYNTLDSIIWLVEDERNEEATMMITALSRFFRIGISGGKTIITVRQELEHARNYLAIQKIRYKNKFEYFIEAEDGIMECLTLKLILQPIIENALYHGIQYIQHQGQIHINVWEEEGVLIFSVQDNGVGMEEEVSTKLLEEGRTIQTKGSGVGVQNVHRRIQLYYGIEYGVEIQSEVDEGTTILIKIPLEG
ncbi:sensor histidine kinase [Niameybacter massiliensis]|uniref:histidine kinase n=1 Tax=Holtiella tumoricola TaxID=3018743 RepID=A0AA42DN76_9FIRM|nr:sensor histidine kinase [Holtiella tumoricola]MDA3731743.1 sensor histidine kinase [Holtiella tumoricola]